LESKTSSSSELIKAAKHSGNISEGELNEIESIVKKTKGKTSPLIILREAVLEKPLYPSGYRSEKEITEEYG